jgi:hypothetical protein
LVKRVLAGGSSRNGCGFRLAHSSKERFGLGFGRLDFELAAFDIAFVVANEKSAELWR